MKNSFTFRRKKKTIIFFKSKWIPLHLYCKKKNYAMYNAKIHDLLYIHSTKHYNIVYVDLNEAYDFISNDNSSNINLIIYFFIITEFGNYLNNIIFINIWSCYNSSFYCFNENPIPKILLSGAIDHPFHPDRIIMKNYNVDYYPINFQDCDGFHNNNYNQLLNKYLGCFSSSFSFISKRKHI